MCGRFAQFSVVDLLAGRFDVLVGPDIVAGFFPRYNLAPTQDAYVIRDSGLGIRDSQKETFRGSASDVSRATSDGPPRRLAFLRWGLVPVWAKDPAMGARMINARAETAAEKPAFREAFRVRRCVVPADGFYEWRGTGRGKQPFFFRAPDRRPLALAGLWERWAGAGAPLETFTILTTAANAALREVHDRMPAILADADVAAWLDPANTDPGRLAALLRPAPEGALAGVPVARHVNDAKCDGPECLAQAEEPEVPGLFPM